jgi:hypothetical protein
MLDKSSGEGWSPSGGLRTDEMGIDVCIECDCAVEHDRCLCDDKRWYTYAGMKPRLQIKGWVWDYLC